jgi:predicted metal-dependent peptidase
MRMSNDKALDRMMKARTALVLDYPFWGSLALRLKIKEAEWCPTAATDGKYLYYNRDFIMGLKGRELLGLMAHELLHVILGHPWRRDGRHPRKWNVAADYVINPMVLEEGFALPEGCLLEEKYKGQTAEWVYARLPDPQQIEGNLFGEVMDAPNGGSGSEGDSEGSEGQVGEGPPVTEEEWKVAVQQAAASARARGDLPGSLEKLVGKLAKPKVNWRAVLRRFIQERCKADYSWSYPSPRYLPHGLYMPSMFSEELGPIAVYIDTSGSIDDTMLAQFGGELQGIVDETKPSKVFVMYWDTRLQHQDVFERGDPIKLHAKGGGGTNFVNAFKMLSELDEEPIAVVFLTDMYAAFPSEPPEIPVLWATPTEDYEAPFGEIVEIRD